MDQKILIQRSGDVTMVCYEPKMDQVREETTTREFHTKGSKEDHAKTSGARTSVVALRKFVLFVHFTRILGLLDITCKKS